MGVNLTKIDMRQSWKSPIDSTTIDSAFNISENNVRELNRTIDGLKVLPRLSYGVANIKDMYRGGKSNGIDSCFGMGHILLPRNKLINYKFVEGSKKFVKTSWQEEENERRAETSAQILKQKKLNLQKQVVKAKCSSDSHGSLLSFNSNMISLSSFWTKITKFGFGKFRKDEDEEDSKCLLEDQKNLDDKDDVLHPIFIKINANNDWLFVYQALAYAIESRIPVLIIYNIDLSTARERFRELIQNIGHVANQIVINDSKIVIFHLNVIVENLRLEVEKSYRYRTHMNERNYFLMLDVNLNGRTFQCINIFSCRMSEDNETILFLRLTRVLQHPSMVICQSPITANHPQTTFHGNCMNAEGMYQLIGDNQLNNIAETEGTLAYVGNNFPLQNSTIHTQEIRYPTRSGQGFLTGMSVIISLPIPHVNKKK